MPSRTYRVSFVPGPTGSISTILAANCLTNIQPVALSDALLSSTNTRSSMHCDGFDTNVDDLVDADVVVVVVVVAVVVAVVVVVVVVMVEVGISGTTGITQAEALQQHSRWPPKVAKHVEEAVNDTWHTPDETEGEWVKLRDDMLLHVTASDPISAILMARNCGVDLIAFKESTLHGSRPSHVEMQFAPMEPKNHPDANDVVAGVEVVSEVFVMLEVVGGPSLVVLDRVVLMPKG
jgi:hypothetical protein